MPDPTPRPPTEVELKMRHRARDHVAAHGWPTGEIALNRLIRDLQGALPTIRPHGGEQPRGPRVPARGLVLPSATLRGASADSETSEPLTGRRRALEGLRSEPTACAVLRMIGNGSTDREITYILGLKKGQARNLYRRWVYATESIRRSDLAKWAQQHAAAEPEAGE